MQPTRKQLLRDSQQILEEAREQRVEEAQELQGEVEEEGEGEPGKDEEEGKPLEEDFKVEEEEEQEEQVAGSVRTWRSRRGKKPVQHEEVRAEVVEVGAEEEKMELLEDEEELAIEAPLGEDEVEVAPAAHEEEDEARPPRNGSEENQEQERRPRKRPRRGSSSALEEADALGSCIVVGFVLILLTQAIAIAYTVEVSVS